MNEAMQYALACLVLLNVLDIFTTLHILAAGGREMNPGLAWLMAKIGGAQALVISKAVLLGFIYYFIADIPIYGLLAICAIYTFVVVNNIRVWVQMRGAK